MTPAEPLYRRTLLMLVLAGALLRLLGLNWDEGRGLHPDEGNLVRAALTLGPGGVWIPAFHAYNDLSLWLPRLLSWSACEGDNRACLTLAARLISALMAIATIPLGAGIARALAGNAAGPVAGLAAAAGLAVSAPLIQWAHFGTTESALTLLVLASWFLAVRWHEGRLGDLRFVLASAAVLGLGFGLKTTVAIVAVIPLTALLFGGWPARPRWIALGWGALLGLGLALASTPSLLAATEDWLAVMRFENGVVTGSARVFWTTQFHDAANGWFELRQVWQMSAGAGLILALAGLALLPRRGWRLAAPALAFALIYAGLTFGWHAKFVRYLAPLLVLLPVLAGVAIGRLAQPLRSRTALALALSGLGITALAGLDLAAGYLRTDPRIAAETWLVANARPGDRVAIEPRDVPQVRGLETVILPLTDAATPPEAVAEALAGAEWLVLSSRRNWAVLPHAPGAPALHCTLYARLADGDLGFVPVHRNDRAGPFGRLFAPGLGAEETRAAFDRPEVFVLRNIDRYPAATLAEILRGAAEPGQCAPETLQAAWRRGP